MRLRREKWGRLLTAQLDPLNTYKGMREMDGIHMLKHRGRRPSTPQIIHFQKQSSPPRPWGHLHLRNSSCSWWKRMFVWWRCQDSDWDFNLKSPLLKGVPFSAFDLGESKRRQTKRLMLSSLNHLHKYFFKTCRITASFVWIKEPVGRSSQTQRKE